MRSDMKSVLTDTHKYGGDYCSKHKKKCKSLEDLPQKQSMGGSRQFSWGAKNSTWRRKPLYRYLNSKVGEKWDNIYSDIKKNCKNFVLDKRNIDDLLDCVVCKDVRMVGGVPYETKHKLPIQSHGSSGYHSLYVNPDNGLLCRAPQYIRAVRKKNNDVRVIDGLWYYSHNGIWYQVVFEYCTQRLKSWGHWRDHWFDIFHGYITQYACMNLYGKAIFAKAKRQLCKREIRKLKLRNKEYTRE